MASLATMRTAGPGHGAALDGGGAGRGARVGNLDILRAVAALAVLAIHAYALGGRVAPIKAQSAADVPLIALASGVWLFFGISGYVISRPFVERLLRGEDPPATVPYALRRGLRIYPLYWVALGAIIAIDGTAGTRTWQLPIHVLLLNNLVPGHQEALFSPAWTLTLEVLFYISVPILAAVLHRRHRRVSAEWLAAAVLASWVASAAVNVAGDLAGDGTVGLWLRFFVPAMWQMFCPGILLAIAPHLRPDGPLGRLRERAARPAAVALAVLFLIAAAILGGAAPLRFGVTAYALLSDASRPLYAIGYGVLIAAALRARPWSSRRGALVELGLISYGIYLIHPVLVALALREGVAPVHGAGVGALAVNTAAVAAVTIPLALLSWRAMERPLLRLARRLGLAWQERHAASSGVAH